MVVVEGDLVNVSILLGANEVDYGVPFLDLHHYYHMANDGFYRNNDLPNCVRGIVKYQRGTFLASFEFVSF